MVDSTGLRVLAFDPDAGVIPWTRNPEGLDLEAPTL